MRGAWAIYRRELAGLFLQPLAWVLLCLGLFLNGYFFTLYLRLTQGDANQALALALGGGTSYWLLMIALPPLLTMRMISEEAKSGMLEFLLTAPVRDAAVVAGKALAATSFMLVLWLCPLAYAATLHCLGATIDWGQLAANLLGCALVASLFCSVSLLASALSGTPLLAAFLGMLFNAGLLLLPLLAFQTRYFDEQQLGRWIGRFNVYQHLSGSFLRGLFDSADLLFFAAWAAVALFLTTRLVEMRRWRL